MSQLAVKLIAMAALTYLALCAALFVFQRSLLYFPQPRALASGAGTLALPTDAGNVLVSTRARKGAQALLYFGGNAEDVSFSLPSLSRAFPEHALYLMHYRGYGGSAGKPSEAALVADALALFERLHAEHPTIVVLGRSLGSGVAVQLTAQRPVQRLVLVTPYHSILELAASQFRYFPVRWLLHDRFESWRFAPLVSAPTLLIAAEHDAVIPRASTDALLPHFRAGVAALTVLPGTGHNSISESPQYLRSLKGLP